MSANLWNEVLGKIRGRVNSHSFNTWFKPTKMASASGRILSVRVPNTLFAEWLRNNYLPLVTQAVQEVQGESWEIRFLPTTEDSRAAAPSAAGSAALPAQGRFPATTEGCLERRETGGIASSSGTLNPRYTFDSFVEGTGNQFACAAAKAVADKPSHSYNPLYIYGGVGLGKTHLMQAIASKISSSSRTVRLQYLTAETFMNELIAAIRHEKTISFKEKYRSIDVFLVDDIQFLAGKERTQEEFFHTFNALYDARKQIVMTSDCAPRKLSALEERLRSRFEWGLIADIQLPDLETKVAILNKKAEGEGVTLPSDVALYIASKIKSNIRELEGTLTRVLACASLGHRPIDIEMVRETLQDLVSQESAVVTIEAVQKQVGEHYNLKVAQMKSKNNSKAVAFPRQVAMYLCKTMTDHSLPEIGRKFGGKHHTTVIHAIRKIEALRRTDRDFDKAVHKLTEALR